MLRLEMVSLFTCYAKKLWEQSSLPFSALFSSIGYLLLLLLLWLLLFFSPLVL